MGTVVLVRMNSSTASREVYDSAINNAGHVFATDCIHRLSCCITL